jgi:hypothetical protein
VPGRFPHPHSDPAGHRFAPDRRAVPADAFLLGVDLFNHGYYWEAHEAWEAGWHACGRHGPLADFFKALIQLAVAGVKIRQEMPDSAIAHALRGAELLRKVHGDTGQLGFMGLDVTRLAAHADQFAVTPPQATRSQCLPVEVLFGFALVPADER